MSGLFCCGERCVRTFHFESRAVKQLSCRQEDAEGMARVFITGSSDGLGKMAALLLIEQGHQIVLHARNEARGREAMAAVPGADGVVIRDLSTIKQVRDVAAQVKERGPFDAVIHNAAVGYQEARRIETEDGLPQVFAVNTLAPYILTALIQKPKRLIYMSSGLHLQGNGGLKDLAWQERPWSGYQAYSDSKLHDTLLAFAIARRWPGVFSNAVNPGWVATKMGGASATDDLDLGHRTQAWLAVSDDPAAKVSGKYLYHQHPREPKPITYDTETQERLLEACRKFSGVEVPN